MHIPSERIYSEMRSNNAIVRYVPTNGGTETALLIKAPTPSLKAMIAGCAFKLIYGKKDNFLCIGISIEDVPGAPLLISNEQIVPEEHCALLESVKQKILPIFLFNEMDICMASAELYFSDEDSLKLLDFIGDTKSLSTGTNVKNGYCITWSLWISLDIPMMLLNCSAKKIGMLLRFASS